MVLRGPGWKALLELYRRRATPRLLRADIFERRNTSSIGPIATACQCIGGTSHFLRDSTAI